MIKRSFVLAICGALLLAACGTRANSPPASTTAGPTQSEAAAQITLQFPTWQAQEPGAGDFWKALVAAYETKYPNVKVNLILDPFQGHEDNVVKGLGAGSPPDVVHMQAPDVPAFASRGWLQSLDGCFSGTDILASWTPLQQGLTFNDKPYGLLLFGFPWVMYYNDQLLAQAGVSVPTTPQELLTDIAAFKGKSGLFGLVASTSGTDSDTFDQADLWVTGNNGSWMANGKPSATDPAVASALDLYRQAVADAPKGVDVNKARTLFTDGKAAFYLDGAFFNGFLDKSASAALRPHLKVAKLPFPVVPGDASNVLAIPAVISPEKQQAVCDLIKLVATPEFQSQYTADFKVPAPRVGTPVPDSLSSSDAFKLFVELSKTATPTVPSDASVHLNFGEYQKAITDAIVRLQTTSDPTAQVLQDLQAKLTSILGQ